MVEENISKKPSNSLQLNISNYIIIPDSIPLIENSDESANSNVEINLLYKQNFNIHIIDELDSLIEEDSPLLTDQNDSEKDNYKDITHEDKNIDITKKSNWYK